MKNTPSFGYTRSSVTTAIAVAIVFLVIFYFFGGGLFAGFFR